MFEPTFSEARRVGAPRNIASRAERGELARFFEMRSNLFKNVPGQWSGGRGESSDLLAGRAEIIVITGPAKFTPSGHTIYLRVAKV